MYHISSKIHNVSISGKCTFSNQHVELVDELLNEYKQFISTM